MQRRKALADIMVLLLWILFSALLVSANCSRDICKISLGKMDCANKGLFKIPKVESEMVEILDMESNYVNVIEKDLKNRFPNVNMINLIDNELKELDLGALLPFDECGAFGSKRIELDVSRNRITKVLSPPQDQQLQSLVKLVMNKNLIQSLPVNAFVAATNLSWLSIMNSLFKIRLPSDRPFLEHPRLQSLLLDGSDASEMSSITFSALPSLTYLSLDACGIRDLSADVFSNLSSLNFLTLEDNLISHIQENSFSLFQSLNTLSLSGNPLVSIDTNILPMNSHSRLILDRTPLLRACAHKHLVEWAIKRSIIIDGGDDIQVKCSFYIDIFLKYSNVNL